MPKAETTESADLIRRFIAGDDHAFSEIVMMYQHRLVKNAEVILGNRSDAMDMVQETFINAYFHRNSFRGESSLYTWLYRILYNVCISTLRSKKNLKLFVSEKQGNTFDLPSGTPDPYHELERIEIRALVDDALQKLPPRQRMVFVMRQIDGLKHREIAEIMEISEGSVKASYFHAVQKLREILADYGGAYGLS
ncbi:RNA polymerase sigma factor [Candidatus Latescibacterota bacterium]